MTETYFELTNSFTMKKRAVNVWYYFWWRRKYYNCLKNKYEPTNK